MTPSIESIADVLSYDPLTGLLTWSKPRPACRPGDVAGRLNRCGYVVIGVHGVSLLAHRIAWAITTGEWPKEEIDHINCDRKDNRIANLREASRSQNHANRRVCNSKSGLKGASWNVPDRMWHAKIKKNGRTIFLGRFSSAESAHEAYVAASKSLFGDFARPA